MRLLTGWIIYNGNLPNSSFFDFANWLHIAAKQKSIKSKIYQNNELLTFVATDSLKLLKEQHGSLPDFVIFTDKDIYLAKQLELLGIRVDRKSTRLNSSHVAISYAVFCLKKKSINTTTSYKTCTN